MQFLVFVDSISIACFFGSIQSFSNLQNMLLLLYIIVTYIKENIITKLQKLYRPPPPRNPRVGNKSLALFMKKPLCTGDIASMQNIH